MIGKVPFKLPAALTAKGHAVLNRSVLRVHGPDALKFLNGLTTNALGEVPVGSGQYSLFLNPQGRVMYDTFIWKRLNDEFLVEADGRIGKDIYYHVKQFQLRSKIQIQDISPNWSCLVHWNGEPGTGDTLKLRDPRGGLGLARELVEEKQEPCNGDLYKTLRFTMGIPEGPLEVPRVQAIPLEYNFDLLGAINYHKGCYVGQELVARTHYRGVIRKRIMPVMILNSRSEEKSFVPDLAVHDQSSGEGEEIMPINASDAEEGAGKSIGRLISTHGNLGMALIRLESWKPEQLYSLPKQNLYIRPYIPPWWSLTSSP